MAGSAPPPNIKMLVLVNNTHMIRTSRPNRALNSFGKYLRERQWTPHGKAVITDVRAPYHILHVYDLWVRPYADYSEYKIASSVYAFVNWPLNHKHRISLHHEAMRVNDYALRHSDAENRWLYMADF